MSETQPAQDEPTVTPNRRLAMFLAGSAVAVAVVVIALLVIPATRPTTGKAQKTHTPEQAITVHGTIQKTTAPDGKVAYTLVANATTYRLSDGPEWWWGANDPLGSYVGKTVDDCEGHKEECYAANVVLVRNLGTLCRELDISLFHISSGCIFDGPGPFGEEAKPNNVGQFYAQCKIHAEVELAGTGARAWVFRIRMPFNGRVHPRNLLCKLASYDRILEGLNSITFLDEFAMRSYHLAQRAGPGVYHASCSTPVRTAQVARMLFDAGVRVKPVELFYPEAFRKAGHVHRSAAVLDVSKFEQAYGAPFGDPLVALRWSIDRLASHKAVSRT